MATMTISGWGNFPKRKALLITPDSTTSIHTEVKLEGKLIARGMGRSYGDSATASKVLQTTRCNHFLEFDENTGRITAEAGITLRNILQVVIPRGWFLPVTPGTSYVTLGGAIASDVHGKNHRSAGTFGQHVRSINMVLGTGEVVTASDVINTDLFHATCGGMGLTGVILSATIQLIPVQSSSINQKTIKADCIEEAFELLETHRDAAYSVAWIDCLAKGKHFGRSVLMLGEHSAEGEMKIDLKDPVSVPFHLPSVFLNRITTKTFNSAYWHKARHNCAKIVPLMPYFYPLDSIGDWNKLHGKYGFLQFQCLIPKHNGIANMRKLIAKVTESGEASLLAVLKDFGRANDNLLSFPTEGYSLALDFKVTKTAVNTLRVLEQLIAGMGGKIYLTKDAVMQEATFKATYPQWETFEAIREKYGAIGKFSSAQSERLGLA